MEQAPLFEIHPKWKDLWKGMPEYEHKDLMPFKSVLVHFRNREDQDAFSVFINQKVTEKTKFIWYPQATIDRYSDKQYASLMPKNPRFPIYIVSKGRHETRYTSRLLEAIGVNYRIVVEEQEYPDYAKVIDRDKILVLDKAYQRDYDTFDDLGDTKSKGPGPARNFAWAHSISEGFEWHWVMDDNISEFFRFSNNLKVPIGDGTVFYCMENFVLRYQNILMAGPNYKMFASRKAKMPPFTLNTRIYSCNLIRNDAPFRWRGRYNEDTDLSLRMLKAGWCTVLFNAFLQGKLTTQTLRGGCSTEFYDKEGTLAKSQMQVDMHPDVSRIVQKFGRIHHYVNYKPFKRNKPILKPDIIIPDEIDNCGMELKILPSAEDIIPEKEESASMAKKAKKVWRHQTYEALAPENITGIVGIDSSLTGMGIARHHTEIGVAREADVWERIGTDADFGSDVQRYFHTLARVLKIVQPNDLCFMEQYALGSPNRNALVQLAGLGEIVRFGIWRKTKREPVMIAPAQLKFFIWGNGVLKKDAVKMEIHDKYSIKFDSTDEAEAYALMDLGTRILFSDNQKSKAYERKVIEEVRAEWFLPKNLS